MESSKCFLFLQINDTPPVWSAVIYLNEVFAPICHEGVGFVTWQEVKQDTFATFKRNTNCLADALGQPLFRMYELFRVSRMRERQLVRVLKIFWKLIEGFCDGIG